MSEDFKIVAKPNNSLSKKGMYIVVGIVTFFSLAIALAFSLMGAWMVLPFAGAEMLLVAGAFYNVQCHANDFESISIVGDELALAKQDYKQTSKVVLNCYWVQVMLQKTPNGNHALYLRSHGKEYEFGHRLMHDDDKVALAQKLKERVGVSKVIA